MDFNTKSVFKILRQTLRQRRKTYRDLAIDLGVSEITVKRMFTSDDLSLRRLEQLCRILEVKPLDVLSAATDNPEPYFVLTEEQERQFAEDDSLYAFFMELFRREHDLKQICELTGLSESAGAKFLLKLDKLGLIDLEPGNRLHFKVEGAHHWIKNGPLSRKFARKNIHEFVDTVAATSSPHKLFSRTTRRMLPEHFQDYLRDLKQVLKTYKRIGTRDESLCPAKDLIDVQWFVVAAPHKENWIERVRKGK